MKNYEITTASLHATVQSNYTEYQYAETSTAEYGHEWEGDVLGYVQNLDLSGDTAIIKYDDYSGGGIHNIPQDAILLMREGEPVEAYWIEG